MTRSENGEHCFSVQCQHSGAPVYVQYIVYIRFSLVKCVLRTFTSTYRSSMQLAHSAFNVSTLVCMVSLVTDMSHHSTELPCTNLHITLLDSHYSNDAL